MNKTASILTRSFLKESAVRFKLPTAKQLALPAAAGAATAGAAALQHAVNNKARQQTIKNEEQAPASDSSNSLMSGLRAGSALGGFVPGPVGVAGRAIFDVNSVLNNGRTFTSYNIDLANHLLSKLKSMKDARDAAKPK